MPQYSVKKPLTIFVAVLAVVVLGIVAYFKMTPDLLPNIDLPYVVVMTTYPGATPEKVETVVTKPIEQSMATLDNIKTVSSTSYANYSLVILEFDDDVNMDTISVDILQNISLIEGYWEDTVGTPYILKINPSMLPVMVAAVNMEGKDRIGISDFAEEKLLNELEGIPGVASISSNGIVEEKVNVFINQDKIDVLNKKIQKSIEEKMAEAKQDLLDAQEEAEDAKKELEDGEKELAKGKEELAQKLAEGSAEIAGGQSKLTETKVTLQGNLVTLKQTKKDLTETKKKLTELQTQITQLETAKTTLEGSIAQLNALLALPDDVILAQTGMTREQVEQQIATLQGQLDQVNAGLEKIDAALAEQGMTRATLQGAIDEVNKGLKKVNDGIGQIYGGLDKVEDGQSELEDAQTTLEEEKIKAILEMADASAKLSIGKDKLETALTQIEDGLDQMDEAAKDAIDAADLSNTVTMGMISGLLTAQNFEMPLGYVEQQGTEYMISVGKDIADYDEMCVLPLFDTGVDDIGVVKLNDVADVIVMDNAATTYARINGNDGVLLSFTKQSTYATAEVSDSISDKFAELSKEYPGLQFTTLMDQGDYIYMIVNSILQNIFLSALFAVLILFVFLRDLRPTVITLFSIPVSIIFAIVLMYFSGVTLNMISLSGLAISVGMLVDNSVVVIENTYRLRALGESPIKAAVSGAKQVAGAITASTLTTICVFLPIVFVEGIIRQLFVDMALTITYSLVASLIIALTLVPSMASFMLKKNKEKKHTFRDKALAIYSGFLRGCLKYKVIVLIVVLALMVFSVVATLAKGFIFMPETSSTQISVTITMPEDTTLEDAVAASDEVMDRVMKIDEVVTVGAMFSSGSSILTSSATDYTAVTQYVMLDEKMKRSTKEIVTEINDAFKDREFTVEAANSSDISSYMTALGGNGVSLNVYSTDNEKLAESARRIAEELGKVEGIVEVSDGMEQAETEYLVKVDKEKAAQNGLTVATVYTGLADLMKSSATSTTLNCEDKDYSVVVHADDEDTIRLSEIVNYEFTTTDKEGKEKKVVLNSIATIEEQEALSEISRYDQKRYLTVSGTIDDDHNVTLVTKDAEAVLSKLTLPSGVSYDFNGESETIMQGIRDLGLMLLLSVLLVYLIMVAQFQSLRDPFVVMFTMPLAITGGLLGLLMAGMEISVISMVGFVMLVGIIVNNGIVLVDYINQLRKEGMERREAIVEAGTTRMRPIFMTSITTILGLCIMAFGGGMENDMVRPIAIVCIGGLFYATLLTLIVVPIMYDILASRKLRVVTEEDLQVSEL